MGLDMYLCTNSQTITKRVHEGEPYGEYITDFYCAEGICLYLRKANAIHRWMVEHVQDGDDDCGNYEVSVEQLQELRDICKRVIDECPLIDGTVKNGERLVDGAWVAQYESGKVMSNKERAAELLPTTSGFFFGSTDYDQWYYEDVRWTAKQLDIILGMLMEKKEQFWTYYVTEDSPDWHVKFWYHSSW